MITNFPLPVRRICQPNHAFHSPIEARKQTDSRTVAHHVLGRYAFAPYSHHHHRPVLLLTRRRAGFKKNVNRATTQVMMKTGQYPMIPHTPLVVTTDEASHQDMSRKRTIETTRLRRGTSLRIHAAPIAGYLHNHRILATNLFYHRRFRTMEAASLRLQKEAKGYLDSLRGMTMKLNVQGCIC